jgi:hypothetical protein
MPAPPILVRPATDDIRQHLEKRFGTLQLSANAAWLSGFIEPVVAKHLDKAFDMGTTRARELEPWTNPPDYGEPPVPSWVEPQPVEETVVVATTDFKRSVCSANCAWCMDPRRP